MLILHTEACWCDSRHTRRRWQLRRLQRRQRRRRRRQRRRRRRCPLRVSKKFNAIFIFHIQDTIIMPKTRSRKKNPLTLAYFKDNDANVQKDSDFFNFARNALRFRTEFTLFPKPVCFASSPHQQEFKVKNRNLMKTCACFSSFCHSTKYK